MKNSQVELFNLFKRSGFSGEDAMLVSKILKTDESYLSKKNGMMNLSKSKAMGI